MEIKSYEDPKRGTVMRAVPSKETRVIGEWCDFFIKELPKETLLEQFNGLVDKIQSDEKIIIKIKHEDDFGFRVLIIPKKH